mgnify:FL=1
MAVERTYYTIDPEGKLTCMKCKGKSKIYVSGKWVSCGNACLSKVWVCVCSGRTRTWKSARGGACTGG